MKCGGKALVSNQRAFSGLKLKFLRAGLTFRLHWDKSTHAPSCAVVTPITAQSGTQVVSEPTAQ